MQQTSYLQVTYQLIDWLTKTTNQMIGCLQPDIHSIGCLQETNQLTDCLQAYNPAIVMHVRPNIEPTLL